MPLVNKFEVLGAEVFLWELLETNHEIAIALGVEDRLISDEFELKSARNTYGWQYVLKMILGEQYSGVYKDMHGKPFLNNSEFNISISHTKTIIACAIHRNRSIGIDIENCSEKIEKIKHKFLAEFELGIFFTRLDLTKVWCIKESVYKLQGKKGVSFKNDIKILGFEDARNIAVFNNKSFEFQTVLFDEMVLAICIDN